MNANNPGMGAATGAQPAFPSSEADIAASATPQSADAFTVGGWMDNMPVGSLHRFVVWVIGIGLFFDMYEIFLVSSIGTALQSEYGINPGESIAGGLGHALAGPGLGNQGRGQEAKGDRGGDGAAVRRFDCEHGAPAEV